MATIEYVYKPMAMGAYHITMIYKPDVGRYEYLSFAASGYNGEVGGFSQGLQHIIGGAAAVASGTLRNLCKSQHCDGLT